MFAQSTLRRHINYLLLRNIYSIILLSDDIDISFIITDEYEII